MLLEFVNRLVELAEKAKRTEILPAGFRTFTKNGILETHPAPPRADVVYDLVGFDELLGKFAADCVVYCHGDRDRFIAKGILDSTERADTISLVSDTTAAYDALQSLEDGLPVRELSDLLRSTLRDAVPQDVTHAVSRIDWTAKDTQTADAATMGRMVTKAVASTSDAGLPEITTLTLPVYDIPDVVIDTDIRCAIVPNYDARTIAIVSIEGLTAIRETATQELCRRIADRFADSVAVTVVYGSPAALKFAAGSPDN